MDAHISPPTGAFDADEVFPDGVTDIEDTYSSRAKRLPVATKYAPEKTVKNDTSWRRAAIGFAATAGVMTLTTVGAIAWGQHEATAAAVSEIQIEDLTATNVKLSEDLKAANKTITQQADKNGQLEGQNDLAVPFVKQALENTVHPKPLCPKAIVQHESQGSWYAYFFGKGKQTDTINTLTHC
jgi:hypothetical protein